MRNKQTDLLWKAQEALNDRVINSTWNDVVTPHVRELHFPKGAKRRRPVRPVLIVDGHYSFKNVGFNGAMDYGKFVRVVERTMGEPLLHRYYVSSSTETTQVDQILKEQGFECDIHGIMVCDMVSIGGRSAGIAKEKALCRQHRRCTGMAYGDAYALTGKRVGAVCVLAHIFGPIAFALYSHGLGVE